VNEILHSFSLWFRDERFKALLLQSFVFLFSLSPTLESAGDGLILNQRKPMLGLEPHTTDEAVRVAPGRRQIALTFDAGDGVEALPELLASLWNASVKSTFFLTGKWVQRYPDSVKQIVTDGHEIGNHSWSHPDLTALSDQEISWEIKRADIAIRSFYGRSTRPLFRAPFGARNEQVLGVVEALGYRSIYWSLDSLDSVGPLKNSSFIIARITEQPDQVLNGAIVLFHVGNESTARALPEILRNLKARHLECVVVSSLISHLPSIGGWNGNARTAAGSFKP
jgi:peptidoglycan/xylan/chitin deacetylase (PgdA/CDA1 family)